jgi:kynureninase
VHKELGERDVICDFRPDPVGGVRLGPHFYNTEDEALQAVDELADIVSSGVYEKHAGAAARF